METKKLLLKQQKGNTQDKQDNEKDKLVRQISLKSSVNKPSNSNNMIQDEKFDKYLSVSNKPVPDKQFSKDIDFNDIYFVVR